MSKKNYSKEGWNVMKCSKLIDKLQKLEYDLEDPDVLLRLFSEYDPEIEVSVEDFADGKVIVIC